MLFAYLSTDEVNQDLAQRMAEECGVTVYCLSFRDPPPDGRFDALLYDWDSLPQQKRQEIMAEVPCGTRPCPAALHSYHVEDKEATILRQKGVLLYDRLEPEVFRALSRADHKVRAMARPATVFLPA
jgi:hypothetical protein